MNKGTWQIVFVSESARRQMRLRIPHGVTMVLIGLFFIATAGFFRFSWVLGSYAVARINVHSLNVENNNLLQTIRFIEKFVHVKQGEINELIAFEERARLKFGINAISDDVRKAGVGGVPSAEERFVASLEDPAVRSASMVRLKIESLLRKTSLQDTTFSRMAEYVRSQHDVWSRRPSIMPAWGRFTSGFGYRMHPFHGQYMFHDGMDIANKPWTPVVATADGIVVTSAYSGDYGNMVKIEHRGNGIETVYAHLHQTAVVQGEVIRRGDVIGYIGSTGRSTGPHLHYEVHSQGRAVNPMDYVLPDDVVVD